MQGYAPTAMEQTTAALLRLEKTLDAENAALSNLNSRDLGEFCRAKTLSLLELQRSGSNAESTAPSSELAGRLQTLQQKLELNRWLLQIHVEAAREVTSVIMAVLRDSESDGTYSRSAGTAVALS